MKILFYPALFLLGFITIAQAQTNNNYPQWQHPILKELRAGSKTLTPFYNKDSTAFITVSVIDNKQKTIYWFDCYGYYFDAVPIPESNIQAIVKKNITAFKYYDLITTDYVKIIIKSRNNFQANGNTAKFTPYEKQLLQIDDSIKFPSTLKKLIELDKQKLSVERQIREFHSINPSKIKEDTAFSRTLAIQYGSMLTTYQGQDTTTTYYNRIALEPVYKAVLNQNEATIAYYNRGEQLIDLLKINKDKTNILLNEKTDVFLIYRGWLELQRYSILDEITNLKTSEKEYNRSQKSTGNSQFTNNSFQTLLSNTNQQLKLTNYKIDYLTTVDRGFVSQCLKKQYQQTSNSLTATEAQLSTFTRGNKFYELTDARGNVMAVVTDKKLQHSTNGTTVDYYEPDIASATDYAPFGSPLPGRNYQSDKYRYGYNGKENDNEVKGQGNQQDYGMRIYDPRLGRFLSRDPLYKKYPELSPYQFASNSPIAMVDIDGLEGSMSISGANMVSPLFQHVEFDVDGDKIPDYNRGWAAGLLGTVSAGAVVLSGGAALSYIGSASAGVVITNITSQAVVSYATYSTAAANVGAFIIELANPDPNGTPGLEFTQGDEIARGIKLIFKQTAAPLVKPIEKFLLNTAKLDYLFGKLEYQNLKGADLEAYASQVNRTVESLTHNQDRAASMAKVFDFWGIKDSRVGFEKLSNLFNAGLNGKEVSSKTNEYGTTVTREISLIFTAGEKKGQAAGTMQIGYFYKGGDMSLTPEISSVIPIPAKTP